MLERIKVQHNTHKNSPLARKIFPPKVFEDTLKLLETEGKILSIHVLDAQQAVPRYTAIARGLLSIDSFITSHQVLF